MSWKPRALVGEWTGDQKRVAAHFPEARRVCVCAANGVGKTYLAADIAVSFLMAHPSALVLFTAPTQRQVEQLLWSEIVRRLKACDLMDDEEPANRPEWKPKQGGTLYGFATNQPERMQGFHAPYMLIVVDEASGMTGELLEAMEAVALGANNYIFAIGNPNELNSAFYRLTQAKSWRQETLSALTHPNIVQRRDVIPGATNWHALLQRVKDWCRPTDIISPDTFSLELTGEEIAYLNDPHQTEPPRFSSPAAEEAGTSSAASSSPASQGKEQSKETGWISAFCCGENRNECDENCQRNEDTLLRTDHLTSEVQSRGCLPSPSERSEGIMGEGMGVRVKTCFFQPNDSFRVRYLGRFPSAGSDTLFSPDQIAQCMKRPISDGGRKFAALDVAREGGDSTIYALRDGDAVTVLQQIPPGDFITQANIIFRLIQRDSPESLIVDCAGLGIGLKDILATRGGMCPVHEFQPAAALSNPQEKKKFLNRRAKAYGNLADAIREKRVSLPDDSDLSADLGAIRIKHTDEQQLQVIDKDEIKARTGRSPDRADAIAMLWENEPPSRPSPFRRRRSAPDSDFQDTGSLYSSRLLRF